MGAAFGYTMIAALFVGLAAAECKWMGWKWTLGVNVAAALLWVWLFVAVKLIGA